MLSLIEKRYATDRLDHIVFISDDADRLKKVGEEEFAKEVGPIGTRYQMEIQVRWDHKPMGDIRVMATIDDGTSRGAFRPVCRDLIVGPVEHDLDDRP